MRIRRLATSLLLVGVAVVSGAVPALAHTELQGITPADGKILAVAPTAVTLAFAASVSLPADPIQISGPGGIRWVVGTATTAGPVVTAPVETAGPAGAYTLAYAVISDDGDTVDGTVTFSLVSAATPTTPTTALSSTSPPNAATPSTTPPDPTSAADQSGSAAARDDEDGGGGLPTWVWTVLVSMAVLAVLVAGTQLAQRRLPPAAS
ncbi:MAG: copper resistance protein CopC [Geodermatophilaceae bacterium]|nr:copper resistance protein CopC [Geodermatophilaceae bacterium]